MRKEVNKYLLGFLLLLTCTMVHAQKEPPKPGNSSGKSATSPVGLPLPIDGGLSFLIVSGIAYGIYESKRKK